MLIEGINYFWQVIGEIMKKIFKRELLGVLFVGIILCISIVFVLRQSPIKFVKERQIEINSVVDYTKFIKSVKNGSKNEIKIDSSKVDIKKLGEYPVTYQFKDKEKTIKVKVVDTVEPKVTLNSKKVALNEKVKPEKFIKKIEDQTKTTVSFRKNYKFDKLGTKDIEIVVEDEGKNKVTKTVKVEVVKDEKAPTIIAGNKSFIIGSKVDLKSIVNVVDDFDPHPVLTIDDSKLDLKKVGQYKVVYVAKDFSGNESKKEVIIQMIDKTAKDEKVVYLTFDDGPSRHTPEVLEILEKYDCKASFFITGMNPNYRKYIKIAHDQGHTIGLHTYSHNYSQVYSSVDVYFDDLNKIGQLAKDYIGYVPKYIRFPGGSSNTISRKYTPKIMTKITKMVENQGYSYYDWNAENGDGYSKMSKSEMIRRATMSKEKKIMILMHDANGKQNTVDILPTVIEHYQKQGYTFKAIDDSSIVPHQHVNN